MGLRSGLAGQLGLVDEVTYGTPVTVTKFYDLTSESIKLDLVRLSSKGIRAGKFNQARSASYGVHRKGAKGSIVFEPQTRQLGLLLKHMMGSISTSGSADPWTHTAAIGDTFGKSLTVQVGRPDITGTIQAFTYSGCKINKWTLDNSAGGLLQCTLDVDAMDESTAVGLATASYPVSMSPLVFTGGTILVSGSQQDVTKCTITGDMVYDTARYMLRGSGLKKEPIQTAFNLTGTFEAEFDGLTQYNRFVNASEIAFNAKWLQQASPEHSLAFNAPLIRIDGETPVVSNTGVITVKFPFTVLDDSATMIYMTLDSTP